MMSGLVRRLVIVATVEGLVLQAHSHQEHHKVLLINYKSQQLSDGSKSSQHHNHGDTRLEAHGIIGFVNVASLSYLVAITKRREVARIYEKPIYLVTDVALLPLTSQQDAYQAIQHALRSSESVSDDSSNNASDGEDEQLDETNSSEISSTPVDDVRPYPGKTSSSSSVAKDVATGNVSFGRFATQWLSRQKSASSKTAEDQSEANRGEPKPASKDDTLLDDIASTKPEVASDNLDESKSSVHSQSAKLSATMGLMPRILRTTKMVFTSGSYFFSYDIDLTRRFEKLNPIAQPLSFESLDPLYFWNQKLGGKLLESSYSNFLTPLLQGFVGQRAFTLSKGTSAAGEAQIKKVTEKSGELQQSTNDHKDEQAFLLTLISRRSTKRSGLRYLRRGIDDEGNVANFVETEQILSPATWDTSFPIRTFLQVRGSIPVYFSQSPYSFKPAVVFHNSPQLNEKAYNTHFQNLKQQYGAVQIALLVDHHATEKPIGDAFEKLYSKSKEEGKADDINFEWFDFHAECRGMKFENVSRLVSKLEPFLLSSNETIIQNGTVQSRQKGVIRTNCMDCLDRTNVAQSAFAQYKLQASLEVEGYSIDFVTDASTNWFNILWADNGDAISRLYASTAALKGDFTRTRKRNWRGAMNDFGLTISRYYSNMVNDYFSQAVIDMLLGNVSWKVFEDFQSTMMSVDPGISVRSGREAAIDTCSKIVIQEPDKEDLIHAWTMLVPNQENTLRTMPFEEAVILLTDAAIYTCKMDWSTEKVARYEKIDLRSIKNIRWGVYVTSTFTDRQMAEDINQGLVIYYTPGKGDIVRVNTRSLQNYHLPQEEEQKTLDGGTGILSWVASSVRSAVPDRMVALKVMPSGDEDIAGHSRAGKPSEVAESITDEIRRAIVGSTQFGEQRGKELVEHSDIISVAEAKKRTGYLEQVSHSLKRLVWA